MSSSLWRQWQVNALTAGFKVEYWHGCQPNFVCQHMPCAAKGLLCVQCLWPLPPGLTASSWANGRHCLLLITTRCHWLSATTIAFVWAGCPRCWHLCDSTRWLILSPACTVAVFALQPPQVAVPAQGTSQLLKMGAAQVRSAPAAPTPEAIQTCHGHCRHPGRSRSCRPRECL